MAAVSKLAGLAPVHPDDLLVTQVWYCLHCALQVHRGGVNSGAFADTINAHLLEHALEAPR